MLPRSRRGRPPKERLPDGTPVVTEKHIRKTARDRELREIDARRKAQLLGHVPAELNGLIGDGLVEGGDAIENDGAIGLDVAEEVEEPPVVFGGGHHVEEHAVMRNDHATKRISAGCVDTVRLHRYTDVSRDEFMDEILALQRRHCVTDVLMNDLIKIVGKALPVPHQCPSSLYMLKQQLNLNTSAMRRYWYCYVHERTLGYDGVPDVCEACVEDGEAGEPGEFYYIALVDTLRAMMEDKKVRKIWGASKATTFIDIMDSPKANGLNLEPDDIALSFNIDGTNLRKSGNLCLWVGSISVDNLPLKYRFNFRRNVIMWVGSGKTDLQVLIDLFTKDLVELAAHPFRWTDPVTGEDRFSKVHLMSVVVDAPAKNALLMSRQFNGRVCGCTVCLQNGMPRPSEKLNLTDVDGHLFVKVKNFTTTVYSNLLDDEAPLRTNEQTRLKALEYMSLVTADPGMVLTDDLLLQLQGITGMSFLLRLEEHGFDCILNMVNDAMHVIQGVGGSVLSVLKKQLDDKMAYRPRRPSKSSVHDKRRILLDKEEEFMNTVCGQITYPTCVTRRPRGTSYSHDYKASEHLNFLLYNLPMFMNLPYKKENQVLDKTMRHLLLTLSYGLHMLLGDRKKPRESAKVVIADRAVKAKTLLDEFLHLWTVHFGVAKCTYLLHSLKHLPKFFELYGPLYAVSGFGPESNLARTKKDIKGTRLLAMQAANKAVYRMGVSAKLSRGTLDEGTVLQKPYNSFHTTNLSTDVAVSVMHALRLNSLVEEELSFFKSVRLEDDAVVKIRTSRELNSFADFTAWIGTSVEDGFVGEVLHLLRSVSKDGLIRELAVVAVLSEKNHLLPIFWKSAINRVSPPLRLDLPIVYGKPAKALGHAKERIRIVSVDLIMSPVLCLNSHSASTAKYMVPSFRMPHD